MGKALFLPEVGVVTGNGIQYPDGLSDSSDWRDFRGVVNYVVKVQRGFNNGMAAIKKPLRETA